MTLPKSIATYGIFELILELDNTDYQVFKRLLKITKEYADHELEELGEWDENQPESQSKAHRNAVSSLENLTHSLSFHDCPPDWPLRVPGNAAVMLTRGRYVEHWANQAFIESEPAQALITRLRDLLLIPPTTVVDGY
jgi:hypothetical protein